jgi:hypothetical protein
MNPVTACPECGAPAGECEVRYHEFLSLEFTRPEYGAVHHLTVASYMLQHSGRLSREGWLYERDLLEKFLVEKASPAVVRERIKNTVDSSKRSFKISSRTGEPVIPKTAWSKTVLDVNVETAEAYCRDVRFWAEAVLADAKKVEP